MWQHVYASLTPLQPASIAPAIWVRYVLPAAILLLLTALGFFRLRRRLAEAARAERVSEERELELDLLNRKLEGALSQLRLIMDTAPALISYIGRDYRYQLANRTYFQWFGLTPEEIRGKHVTELIGTENYQRVLHHLEKAFSGEQTAFELDASFTRVGKRCLQVTYAPDFDPQGVVRGIVVLATDVTERKRIEEAVSESENAYRTIFELAGTGKEEIDPSTGRFLRVNRKLCAMLGYSHEELLARTIVDVTFPADREAAWRNYVQVRDGREDAWLISKRYLRKDGTPLWVRVTGTMIRDAAGKAIRSIATIQDISDFKASEERLRLALEAGRMALWELDLRTFRISRSEQHDALFGYPQPRPEWTHADFVAALHPDDRLEVTRQLDRLTRGEAENYSGDYRVIWPDGSVRWLSSRARLLRDAEGTPTSLLGVLVEITRLKQTQLNLEEAVRARDEFVSVASHELRTPLTTLVLQTQLIRRIATVHGEGEAFAPERMRGFVSQTEKQLSRLARLVDDMLDISRINTGRLTLHPERSDLARIVRDTVERLRPQAAEAHCEVRLRVPDSIPGRWDPFRIEQIIVNLLTNAFRYASGRPVDVTVSSSGNAAEIHVLDRGRGIAAKDQARIFQRFERADTSGQIGGLGLGLHIVKQIVDRHDGRIRVQSEPGKGAEFIVTLPRSA